MRSSLAWLVSLSLLALALFTVPAWAQVELAQPGVTGNVVPRQGWLHPSRYPSAAPTFVENRGQWDTEALFVGRWGATITRLERAAIVLQLQDTDTRGRGVVVRVEFEGANPALELEGEERRPGIYNFLIGNDPAGWRTHVPGYASVIYRGLYDGVDLRVREQGGHIKYDLLLAPGADLAAVHLRCEGGTGLRIDQMGTLILETAVGPIRQPLPETWEVIPSGERRPVECHYRLHGDQSFGFEAAARDPTLPLVVDPGLVWSTYLGGVSTDAPNRVALGTSGEVTVAGGTYSIDFPTTPGAFDNTHQPIGGINPKDVFVTQLDPTGTTLVFSTFLGGNGYDTASGLGVGADGTVTVGGRTTSTNFPTTPGAFDQTPPFGSKMFITRLDATGSALVFSTVLGGMGISYDFMTAMHVDDAGAVTVTGQTASSDYPTTPGAFKPKFPGLPAWDALVTRLSPDGSSLIFSTLLGGSQVDTGFAVDVGADGTVTVSGRTASVDFPVTPGAFDTVPSLDATRHFVTRFDPTGSSLVFSTFFGGTPGGSSLERITDLAVDASGATTLTGWTQLAGFPVTPGAFDTVLGGSMDAFLSRLSRDGSSLIFSTLLGEGGSDEAYALTLDSAGVATVAGRTYSSIFPATPGAFQVAKGRFGPDCFLARFNPDGSKLLYATYLGGSGDEATNLSDGFRLATDAEGEAVIACSTKSSDFPTTPGAFDEVFDAIQDGFVSRLDMLPTGVSKFGTSTHSCLGFIQSGVTAMPVAGDSQFGLWYSAAPPSSVGWVVVGFGSLRSGIPVAGFALYLDPALPIVLLPLLSGPQSFAELTLPLPGGTTGLTAYFQSVWLNTPACGGFGTLSSSNALCVTVQ